MRIAVWCVALSCLGSASAQTTPGSAYRALEGCPDAEDVSAILRDLGGDATSLEHGPVRLEIDGSGSGELRARIWLEHSEPGDPRVLYGVACEPLVHAALLVVALASDDAVKSAPEERVAEARTAAASVPRERVAISAAPLLSVLHGVLPRAALGVGLELALRYRRWELSLAGAYHPPRSSVLRTRDASEQRDAAFSLTTFHARAQLNVISLAHFRVAPALGLVAGRVTGSGSGFPGARSEHGSWLGGSMGAFGSLEVHARFALIARGELVYAWRSPRFEAEGFHSVHRASALNALITTGFAITLR